MTTVADALEYFRLGWTVIPVRNGTKVADRAWMRWQSRPPCEKTIRNWIRVSGRLNIAVVLGPVSGGLICRDFDKLESYHAGRPSIANLPTFCRR